MTPLHWVLFAALAALALASITQRVPMKSKLPTFLTMVCLILCLIVGQPK